MFDRILNMPLWLLLRMKVLLFDSFNFFTVSYTRGSSGSIESLFCNNSTKRKYKKSLYQLVSGNLMNLYLFNYEFYHHILIRKRNKLEWKSKDTGILDICPRIKYKNLKTMSTKLCLGFCC